MYDKRRNNRSYPRNSHYLHSRPPFDVYMVEEYFPKVSSSNDLDNSLHQAILKRNVDLTPTPEEQTSLVNLVSKVQMVLEKIALSPGTFDACQIEEVRIVGSFKRGTMRTGRNMADMIVILKTLPVIEAVNALGSKVLEELVNIDSTPLKVDTITGGFEISSETNPWAFSVRVLVATILPNMKKLDSNVHVSIKLLQRHMAAIRHARWFEENANSTAIKGLIRVLRDVCSRYSGLSSLTPWMVDVLVHYSFTFRHCPQTSPGPLPLGVAFKRFFQLLSGGIFLPGSTGIPDPCEVGLVTMHGSLSLSQQDEVCSTSQTLLRVMCHGTGYRVVLGIDPDLFSIADSMSIWDGVVVAPSNSAYEQPTAKEEEESQQDSEKEVKIESVQTCSS